MNKILVFAAHPDDELLGEGATIRRLVNEGAQARAVILGEGMTSRGEKRADTQRAVLDKLKENAERAGKIIGYSSLDFCDFPDNRFDSVDLLSIIKKVLYYVEKYQPDTVFTHHHGDLNIDHQRTYEAVITALRPVNGCKVKEIYCFETPSSTEWDFRYGTKAFTPQIFVDVEKTLPSKLEAMACYLTEGGEFPHPRSLKALEHLAKYRGAIAGMQAAETFELVRKMI